MARKAEKTADPGAAAKAAAPMSLPEQLAALKPDASLELAGRKITMREYGFFEGMEVAHKAASFIADIHEACKGGKLRYVAVRRLFGVHSDVVIEIAAQAADVDAAWVRTLNRDDAETFMSTWFGVNNSFFINEVIVEALEDRQLADLKARNGSSSSSTSPMPDSGTSIASDGAPSGS